MSDFGDDVQSSLSDEQKLEIARKLMLQSPPGEILQVASDVRALVKNDALINSIALDVFREYNEQQMVTIAIPDSSEQVLVTKVGEVETDQYLNPRTAQVVTVDQIKQVVIDVRPAEEHENTSPSLQAYREELDASIESYIAETYPSAPYAVYGFEEKDGSVLTLCISNARFSPKNFWNGRWRCVWTAKLNTDQTTWEITARIKVLVHYFEEGNVQVNTSHTHAVTMPVQGVAADVAAMVNEINKVETDFAKKLHETYITLNDNHFKDLRRNLPLTRMKFQWTNAAASLASELKRNKA